MCIDTVPTFLVMNMLVTSAPAFDGETGLPSTSTTVQPFWIRYRAACESSLTLSTCPVLVFSSRPKGQLASKTKVFFSEAPPA